MADRLLQMALDPDKRNASADRIKGKSGQNALSAEGKPIICILHCLTAGFAEQIGRVAPAVGRDAEHSGRLGFLPAEAGFHL